MDCILRNLRESSVNATDEFGIANSLRRASQKIEGLCNDLFSARHEFPHLCAHWPRMSYFAFVYRDQSLRKQTGPLGIGVPQRAVDLPARRIGGAVVCLLVVPGWAHATALPYATRDEKDALTVPPMLLECQAPHGATRAHCHWDSRPGRDWSFDPENSRAPS